jgi:hypothetical protein
MDLVLIVAFRVQVKHGRYAVSRPRKECGVVLNHSDSKATFANSGFMMFLKLQVCYER